MSGSVVRSEGGSVRRSMRRSWRLRRSALAVVTAGSIVLLGACSSEEPLAEPVTTTTVAVTTTTKATAEDLAFHEAEAAYRRHIALLNRLARSPGDKALLDRLGDTSTGIERSTWQTWYGKIWIDRGWRWRRGETVVRDVRPVRAELGLDPPQLKIRTCDDATSAVVVDRQGKPVRDPRAPAMSLTSTTMAQGSDGVWRVSR